MVNTCAIHGCHNRQDKAVKRGFYAVPKVRVHEGQQTEDLSRLRRETWITRINRKNFTPTDHTKICSDHFVQGKPAYLHDQTHPDWAPSLKLADESIAKGVPKKSFLKTKLHWYHRLKQRSKTREQHVAAEALLGLALAPMDITQIEDQSHESSQDEQSCCKFLVAGSHADKDIQPESEQSSVDCEAPLCNQMKAECQRLTTDNLDLRQKLEDSKITEDSFRDNDKKDKESVTSEIANGAGSAAAEGNYVLRPKEEDPEEVVVKEEELDFDLVKEEYFDIPEISAVKEEYFDIPNVSAVKEEYFDIPVISADIRSIK